MTIELDTIATNLVAPGKGILAADESLPTIEKRFKPLDIDNTEENRRQYRQLLFMAPDIDQYISGVILYDETIRQRADDNTPFPDLLERRGIIPGIKVDKGAKELAGSPGETVTEGLDGLRERVRQYRELGARFAKWRAVIDIGPGKPTRLCIDTNAHALARYAAICQEGGLVPIVEPEVLMDGDHDLARCEEVTEATLHAVFHQLWQQRVRYEAMLLKPNMVVSGKRCPRQADIEHVAEATLRCLRRTVPAVVPGIVFLSGGQSDALATAHLDAMNRRGPHPWELSFSYGRALQAPALKAWGGKGQNLEAGKKAFTHRAKLNGAARYGRYSPELEHRAS